MMAQLGRLATPCGPSARHMNLRTPKPELSWITKEVQLMRILFSVLALLLATLPSRAFAQSEPISTARMSLAVGRLPSVVDMPLFFRLYRVSLPVGQLLSYDASTAMLYGLSGAATIDIDGTARPIAEGAALFIPAGKA